MEKEHYLLHAFLSYLVAIWENLKMFSGKISDKIGVHKIFDKIVKYSGKHPYIAVFTSITFLMLASPLLAVVMFAMGFVVITFSGFMFIEGTLITTASVLSFGCLSACLMVFIFFGLAAVAGYCGFMRIYNMWNQKNQREA